MDDQDIPILETPSTGLQSSSKQNNQKFDDIISKYLPLIQQLESDGLHAIAQSTKASLEKQYSIIFPSSDIDNNNNSSDINTNESISLSALSIPTRFPAREIPHGGPLPQSHTGYRTQFKFISSFNLPSPATSLGFSQESAFLALSLLNGDFLTWRIGNATPEQQRPPEGIPLHARLGLTEPLSLHTIHYHPIEAKVIGTIDSGRIYIYDVNPQKRNVPGSICTDSDSLLSCDVHPTGSYLLIGGDCPYPKLYDLDTLLCYVPPIIQQHIMSTGRFDTDITSSSSSSPPSSATLQQLNLHSKPINYVKYSNFGGLFVTSSHDGDIRIWSTDDTSHIIHISQPHNGNISTSIVFSPNDDYILSYGRDGYARLIQITTGTTVMSYGPCKNVHLQGKAWFSHDLSTIFMTNEGREIYLYDTVTGIQIAMKPVIPPNLPNVTWKHIVHSYLGDYISIVDSNNTIVLYNNIINPVQPQQQSSTGQQLPSSSSSSSGATPSQVPPQQRPDNKINPQHADVPLPPGI